MEIAVILVKSGAEINITDCRNLSPLAIALKKKYVKLAEYLV